MTDDNVARDAVVIERSFAAPAEVIWKMWTEPQHFAAWYGPAGAEVTVVKMEVRVGGRRLVSMKVQTPDGPMQMWFTGEYREVVANERIVYTESVSEPDSDVVSPSDRSLSTGYPTTTEVTVELTDVGNRTNLVVTHVGVPADSPGAAGWTMALDKLVVLVEAQNNR